MLTQKDLEAFRDKLLSRRIRIEKNLIGTSLELKEMGNLELSDEGDYAAISIETAVDDAIITKQQKELAEIDLALDKIKSGTYGICEMCEEPIEKARLEVKVFARFCIACREINEKEESN